jgi:hypothetical protein
MPAQGTAGLTPLAKWLNKVGMTSRELMRRIGYGSTAGFNDFVHGKKLPALPVLYEIERATSGEVPIECWMSLSSAKEQLAHMRKSQPEQYRPKTDLEERPDRIRLPTESDDGDQTDV